MLHEDCGLNAHHFDIRRVYLIWLRPHLVSTCSEWPSNVPELIAQYLAEMMTVLDVPYEWLVEGEPMTKCKMQLHAEW